MKFDQTPHPLVEDHYHIQDLINAQERRANDRQYHRDRVEDLGYRDRLIVDNKARELMDFWCDKCQLDIKSECIRQVEVDWSNPRQHVAFYKTKCFQGHWCIRLITDRHIDAYFYKSRRVARDRGEHVLDIVQPWEVGFNMLYGKSN